VIGRTGWFAIQLKADKTLESTQLLSFSKYDRDVVISTLAPWLKPANAAKTEALINASGQAAVRRLQTSTTKAGQALFLGTRATRRGAQL
jgi:hypothetical protein